MPFDPALPVTGSRLAFAEMRAQFIALFDLIHAVPVGPAGAAGGGDAGHAGWDGAGAVE